MHIPTFFYNEKCFSKVKVFTAGTRFSFYSKQWQKWSNHSFTHPRDFTNNAIHDMYWHPSTVGKLSVSIRANQSSLSLLVEGQWINGCWPLPYSPSLTVWHKLWGTEGQLHCRGVCHSHTHIYKHSAWHKHQGQTQYWSLWSQVECLPTGWKSGCCQNENGNRPQGQREEDRKIEWTAD